MAPAKRGKECEEEDDLGETYMSFDNQAIPIYDKPSQENAGSGSFAGDEEANNDSQVDDYGPYNKLDPKNIVPGRRDQTYTQYSGISGYYMSPSPKSAPKSPNSAAPRLKSPLEQDDYRHRESQESGVQYPHPYEGGPINQYPHAGPSSQHQPHVGPSDQHPPVQNIVDVQNITGSTYHLKVPTEARGKGSARRGVYRIPLTPEGNLVIDLPVSRQLFSLIKRKEPVSEFGYMRYTAVTCNPNEFISQGYRLKMQEMGRRAELLIALTMYNEDDNLFFRSMTSILKNIRHFCSRSNSATWGPDGWKKIVICIIADGRMKINHNVLSILGIMGVYQDGVMKDHINNKPVTAHLFEHTSQIYINSDFKVKGADSGYAPAQVVFCLKEKNAKKINSHRWIFQAFAPLLKANVCVLVDVGTRPTSTSLYQLWKAFKNPHVAGACGEIQAEKGYCGYKLLNPIVGAQNFEYKVSNIFDKPLESVAGYISVLPGAFSAYRFSSLVGAPLKTYFKGESLSTNASLLTANLYLAEDRVLCFELVTKKHQGWILKYVKSAKANTDVPSSVDELISQRRRWLNGSFCASLYSILHWYRIFTSGQGFFRKLVLLGLFFYNFVNLLVNWLGISFYALTFYFVLQGAAKPVRGGPTPFFGQDYNVFVAGKYFYLMAIIAVFISSMGNRPKGFRVIYILSMITFSLFNLLILYVSVFETVTSIMRSNLTNAENVKEALLRQSAFQLFVLSIFFSLIVFIVSGIAYMSPWHLLNSSIQYLLIMPTYTNIISIYSFCNLHDVSWGTKGDSGPANDLGKATTFKVDSGMSVFNIEIRGRQEEIDLNYNKFVKQLENPLPTKKVKKVDELENAEDYLRGYRTKIVLLWILTNGILVAVLLSDFLSSYVYQRLGIEQTTAGGAVISPFLKFCAILIIALNGIKFIGSMLYLILR